MIQMFMVDFECHDMECRFWKINQTVSINISGLENVFWNSLFTPNSLNLFMTALWTNLYIQTALWKPKKCLWSAWWSVSAGLFCIGYNDTCCYESNTKGGPFKEFDLLFLSKLTVKVSILTPFWLQTDTWTCICVLGWSFKCISISIAFGKFVSMLH